MLPFPEANNKVKYRWYPFRRKSICNTEVKPYDLTVSKMFRLASFIGVCFYSTMLSDTNDL